MGNQPKIHLAFAQGTTNILTVAPDHVTVKLAKGTTPQESKKVLNFVDYILEQFVDCSKETWIGEITFERDGVEFGHVVLRSGNRTRSYLGVASFNCTQPIDKRNQE